VNDLTAGTSPASVSLRFSAGRDAAATLTWAQNTMWGPMQWFGKEANQFNISRAITLPCPLEQDRVIAALRRIIEGHQTLRTHFVASGGQPCQQVSASGGYEITVADAQDDPEAVSAGLVAQLAQDAFDHEAEWPLRVGWVLDGERRVAVVAVVGSHLAFDGWAFNRLADLLLGQLASDAGPALEQAAALTGAAGLQPLEQAAYQQSAAGQAQNQRGLQHWEHWLSATPASMFDMPRAETGDFPIERCFLDSSAVTVAAAMVAERTRTSFSTVLLCLTALVLTAYNGHDTCALKLIAGNRLDKRHRDLIALNALDAWLTVPIEDTDLDTAIKRINRLAFEAYRRAECDPLEVRELVRESGRRRGVPFDLSAYFNNGSRGSDWQSAVPDLGSAELSGLRRKSRFTSLDPLPRSDMKFMVAVTPLEDGVGRLGLLADTAYLPAPVAEQILRGIEALLCDAVTEEIGVSEIASRTGIKPVRRDPQWIRTPTGWVDLEEVERLIRQAAGGAEVAVFTRDDRGSTTTRAVTACVASALASPQALHQKVLDLLPDHAGAAAPDEYVICPASPRDPGTLEAWQVVPGAAHGLGRRLV
jgi:Condensation domain